jgi:signal transduction histidine kinase
MESEATPKFHFGTLVSVWFWETVHETNGKAFSYQRLSEGVLVWHSTCNRRGQSADGDAEMGSAETGIWAGDGSEGFGSLTSKFPEKFQRSENDGKREQAMQQMEQTSELNGAERKRVEAVVQTLATAHNATQHNKGENLEEVAHDARNMVTALGLYCDLLEEPGVLKPSFQHYGSELRLVAAASRHLVEKLVALDTDTNPDEELSNGALDSVGSFRVSGTRSSGFENSRGWVLLPARPIDSFRTELEANLNLLAALAGASISVTLNVEDGVLPVSLTAEDLTRVLVNLVKNAAEAMSEGGRITLALHEFHAGNNAAPWLVLTVEDNGPGIPQTALGTLFEAGCTTRAKSPNGNGSWPGTHRGLGLSITRSIVEAAGGRIHAANHDPGGARFVIELPVRTVPTN